MFEQSQAFLRRESAVRKMPNESRKDVPCMLSEFDRPVLRKLLGFPGPYVNVSAIALALATLSWLFGMLANTNGLSLHFQLLQPDRSPLMDAQHKAVEGITHVYGYMGEPNHGWFYFLGLPLFLSVWLYCLTALSAAFDTLSKKRILIEATAVAEISKQNKLLMTPFLLAVPVAITLSLWGEYRSLTELRGGYNLANVWNIGHIQSRHLQEWLTFFNGPSNSDLDRWDLLKGKYIQPALIADLRAHGLDKYHDEDKLSEALRNSELALKADSSGGPTLSCKAEAAMFWLFFVFSVTLSGLFTGIVIWSVAKVTFWIALLARLIIPRPLQLNGPLPRPDGWRKLSKRWQNFYCLSNTTRIEPYYEDKTTHRFGMGDLHLPYNLLLITLEIGLTYRALQNLNTFDLKPLATDHGPVAHWSMVINSGLPLIVAALIFIGPMGAFYICLHIAAASRRGELLRSQGTQHNRLRALEKGLSKMRMLKAHFATEGSRRIDLIKGMSDTEEEINKTRSEVNDLADRLEVIKKQQTWPWRDKLFWSVVITFLSTFLYQPVRIVVKTVGPLVGMDTKKIDATQTVPSVIRDFIWTTTSRNYGLGYISAPHSGTPESP